MVDTTAAERVEERLAKAVWAGPVSALRCVPLSAYAADGKPATYSKGPAVLNGSGGLYGGEMGILCGPGIAGDALRLLCEKSGGLVASIGP
jgi:hypothetical protein